MISINFRYECTIHVSQGEDGIRQACKVFPIDCPAPWDQPGVMGVPMDLLRSFESKEVNNKEGEKYHTEVDCEVQIKRKHSI